MVHNNKEVLEYWNQGDVESMYDKNLIKAEINLIKSKINPGSKILDAGCGEAEGTEIYANIPGVTIQAVDFSETRLKKAQARLKDKKNITLRQVDFLQDYKLDNDYDLVITQRFLINLMEWELQKKVLTDLMKMLKPGGRLIMLEGSVDGVNELNKLRQIYNLQPIPIKWHNLFFNDTDLIDFMKKNNFSLIEEDGLGEYFFLTRAIRPIFDKSLDWQNKFNEISASEAIKNIFNLKTKFSRLKVWIFTK